MAHVDWLTIVGRRDTDGEDWTVNAAYVTAAQNLIDNSPTFREVVGNPLKWQIVKPRAPYSFARRSDDCTRTLYVHPLATHFTLELSGVFCQSAQRAIPQICADFTGLFSRLDVAVDMECQTTPFEFDDFVKTERYKTRSRMESSTGQTVYIGSRSSEKFCRVYRYKPPHPRHKLLRAEWQLKGQYANAYAEEIASGVTVDSLAEGLAQDFGFTHGAWEMREAPKMVRVPSHAQSGSTVAWLTGTVAPLLRRLKREGRLDVDAWFAEYVTNAERGS